MNLTPGGNAPVPNQSLVVRISSGTPVDVSSFRLYDNGKVRGDLDMVFYGQRENDDKTICLSSSGNETMFTVSLPQLRQDVQKIAFTATCDAGKNVSQTERLAIQVEANGTAILRSHVDLAGRTEAALILGELYRRNGEWKFRFVSQGFNGGLKPLAEHFGVDISDAPPASPAPPPAPKAPPTPSVNLSKVSLTKEKPSISLTKKNDYGQIRINLNWNQRGSSTGSGFLKGMFNNNKGIDLDLAAFVELSDGHRTIVQALGNRFGSFRNEPFVELQGDDRTGAASDGEWIHINGSEWKNIREVLVFAFIYEGVPSWENTDGSVTITVPGQPPVETFMTEGNNRQNMCAIARLVNEGGAIRVERINRYFGGHQELDQAFGWGFSWKAGSK
ncbi:TerD family protein [Pantoea piersonii]|uniref:TerD family protein n=1 Tax=Pantoea piersonii TaxID=2364647 RepID=UPI0028A206A5|nr:TerD family protein [Pantoea piersonii]